MSPFLPRGILKRKDQPPDPSTPPNATTSPQASPSLPSTPTPPSLASSSSHQRVPIPNTDSLPPLGGPLEGLLNVRVSMLQKLADRVELVNEWLEMDGIVLEALIEDAGEEDEPERAGREAAERAQALAKENEEINRKKNKTKNKGKDKSTPPPAASPGILSPARYRFHHQRSGSKNSDNKDDDDDDDEAGGSHRRVPSGEARVPEVFLKGVADVFMKGVLKSGDNVGTGGGTTTRKERVDGNCGVRDLRERIRAMKRWRRELERTVYWQRTEHRRVQDAIDEQRGSDGDGGGAKKAVQFGEDDGGVEGKGTDQKKEGGTVKETGVHHEEGWGVGGRIWEKKSGKVPTEAEWRDMFSQGRIGWDERGSRKRFLGC